MNKNNKYRNKQKEKGRRLIIEIINYKPKTNSWRFNQRTLRDDISKL